MKHDQLGFKLTYQGKMKRRQGKKKKKNNMVKYFKSDFFLN